MGPGTSTQVLNLASNYLEIVLPLKQNLSEVCKYVSEGMERSFGGKWLCGIHPQGTITTLYFIWFDEQFIQLTLDVRGATYGITIAKTCK